MPLLEGQETVSRFRAELVWHSPNYYASGFLVRIRPQAAIRSGDFKLVKYFESGVVKLYNLGDDLGERHDLSEELPKTRDELLKRLELYYEAVDARLAQPNPDFENDRHND